MGRDLWKRRLLGSLGKLFEFATFPLAQEMGASQKTINYHLETGPNSGGRSNGMVVHIVDKSLILGRVQTIKNNYALAQAGMRC